MTATYYVRNVFGTPKRYPENEVAKAIAKIAGTTTLRTSDMAHAETGLGITWEVVHDPELATY